MQRMGPSLRLMFSASGLSLKFSLNQSGLGTFNFCYCCSGFVYLLIYLERILEKEKLPKRVQLLPSFIQLSLMLTDTLDTLGQFI